MHAEQVNPASPVTEHVEHPVGQLVQAPSCKTYPDEQLSVDEHPR